MPYCVQSDVAIAAGGAERLVELTDLEVTGVVNLSALSSAIERADEEINSACHKRYRVPFLPVPGYIKNLSAELAVIFLKMRRNGALTGEDERQYERLREDLVHLSTGRKSPGVQPEPEKSSQVAAEATERLGEEYPISRDQTKGFW